MKRLATWYEWALLLPALLPLFYVQGTMYPLLAPKVFALRALGVVALALFAYLALAGRPFFWSRLRGMGAWIPAALLALAYLASAFGTDFYHSFWSTFERGDGLLTLTVCIGYFYLLLLSAEREWLSRLLKLAGWTGSLAALYLVFQWLEVSGGLDLPFIVKPNGRIGGTMGNAAFLAAYLGMTFFAALAVARDYREWARWALYAGAGLQIFAILLTATRGTMLALGVAPIAFLIYSSFRKPEPPEAKNGVRLGLAARSAPFFAFGGGGHVWARATLMVLVIIGGLFYAFRAPIARIPFEPVRRIASISLADPTVSSRLFVWRSVSREAFSRPLLGYGAEHIDVTFDRIYDPSVMVEEWFDRSHNAYLDYFVQFGAGGLMLYLALVALLTLAGWRLWRAGDRYGIFLLGVAIVYATQNFFVFDTAMTLWFLLALLALALVYQPTEESAASLALVNPRPLAGALVGVVILYLVIPVAIRPLRANLLAFEAYQYQIVDVPRAKAAADAGLALGTYADLEFGYNAYFIYTAEQVNRLSGGDLRAAHENAVALLAHNFNRYPYDARTAVYLAQTLSLASPGASADDGLLSNALERAIRLSPKRAQPWYILANLSISRANEHPPKSAERIAGYAAAQDILTKYVATVPTLSTPRFVLAQLLYASGAAERAAAEAAKGNEYYRSDLETARRAATYYETVLDLPNAAFFLREIIQLDPGNTAAADDLATIEAYESKK